MANELPKGESVSNAYRTDPQAVQYIDAKTSQVKSGYPAYGGSGALIGYVEIDYDLMSNKLGNTLENGARAVSDAYQTATDTVKAATEGALKGSEYIQDMAGTAALAALATTPNRIQAASPVRPAGAVDMGVLTGGQPGVSSAGMDAPVTPAAPVLGTTGTGTSTDYMQPLPRPAYVEPKIEMINGKEVVTIEGGSLNRMLTDFYTMGQFYAATEMNMEPPKPQTQYSPETGRKIVDFADPNNSAEAQSYATQLQQANPGMSSNQIFNALKMPSAPTATQASAQKGKATIDQLKGMRM